MKYIEAAKGGGNISSFGATYCKGFTGDDSWGMFSGSADVLIEHPGHYLSVCVDIWCWDIDIGSDVGSNFAHIST